MIARFGQPVFPGRHLLERRAVAIATGGSQTRQHLPSTIVVGVA